MPAAASGVNAEGNEAPRPVHEPASTHTRAVARERSAAIAGASARAVTTSSSRAAASCPSGRVSAAASEAARVRLGGREGVERLLHGAREHPHGPARAPRGDQEDASTAPGERDRERPRRPHRRVERRVRRLAERGHRIAIEQNHRVPACRLLELFHGERAAPGGRRPVHRSQRLSVAVGANRAQLADTGAGPAGSGGRAREHRVGEQGVEAGNARPHDQRSRRGKRPDEAIEAERVLVRRPRA